MKTIRYIEGNALTLYIPVVLLSEDGAAPIEASSLSDLHVSLNNKTLVAMTSGSNVLVQLGSELKKGMYALDVKAIYEGRDVCLHVDGAIEIVGTSRQSNWQDFITGEKAILDTQIYIAASLMTDEEFEELKHRYIVLNDELAIARSAADAAKAEADAVSYEAVQGIPERFDGLKDDVKEAVEEGLKGATIEADLTPVTSRLDNADNGLAAIKTAVDNIEIDIPEGIATEANATANKNEVLTAIGNIHIDVPSDIAKESTAQAARVAAEAAQTAAERIVIPSDIATSEEVNAIDNKLGDFADSNAAAEIADIKTAVGDALDEVTGDVSGYVSNKEIAEKVDEVKALVGYAITEIDTL